MRINRRSVMIEALVMVFLCVHAPRALAAQGKPFIKVIVGYGSTDGGVAILGFAKETKLFEKRDSTWCLSAWAPDRYHCGP